MAKFFIDAGHGGAETGAIGNGMIEKNINLVVALEVERLLKLNGQDVQLSRGLDMALSIANRCKISNNYDYGVSIHHNANDGKTTGAEVYHSIHGGKGKELANSISEEFSKHGRKARVISRESEKNKGVDFYGMIRDSKIPMVIVEYGYMDSQDYINFDTQEELLEEALMIAKGCLALVNITDVKTSTYEKNLHWAQGHYNYLRSRGILIHEDRFDDKITRGELFALLAQIIK
jgi:N-acetylmuramoyl-L-alanine amidase